MEGGGQILLSGAAVAIAVIIYEFGKAHLQQQQKPTDKWSVKDQWGSDPIIKEAHRQAELANQKYPSCQVFNEDFMVFLDTGDANADGSPTKCFVTHAEQNPRYLTNPGGVETIQFGREDPLDDDPDEHGTCWFLVDGQWASFPDLYTAKATAPNRSARLCFGSGETRESQGRFFQKDNGNVIMAPTVLPGPLPRCETYSASMGVSSLNLPRNLPPFKQGQGFIISGWTPVPGQAAANTNQDTCLALDSASDGHARFVTSNAITFKNPMTGVIEQMPNVPF